LANYSILVKVVLDQANLQTQLNNAVASLKIPGKPVSVGVVVDTLSAEKSLAALEVRMQQIKKATGANAIEYKINTQVVNGQEEIVSATLRYNDALGRARVQTLGLSKDQQGVVEWIEKANTYTENSVRLEQQQRKMIQERERAYESFIAGEQQSASVENRIYDEKVSNEKKIYLDREAAYAEEISRSQTAANIENKLYDEKTAHEKEVYLTREKAYTEEISRSQTQANIDNKIMTQDAAYAQKQQLDLAKRNAVIETTNMNLERMAATSAKAFATPQVQASVTALKNLEVGYRNGTVSQLDYDKATKRLNTDLAIQKDALNTVNKQGMGFVSMLELAAKKILIWGIGTGIIYGVLRDIKDGIQYIKDLNKELTNIQLVTGGTAEQMGKLAIEFNNVATELGTTTIAVAKGALEWQRAGYNVEDTAKLLKASMMQASLGNMDAAQSTDRLISTLKGFQLTADDAMSVISKLVQLDNNYASSVSEISSALSYSSSVAKEAGITFDELASYITVTSSITRQSAETIGTAYKTLITRFTQVKAGVAVDDLGESLNGVEKVLGKVGIALRDSADSFRPLGNVIDEISKKWSGFSEIQKAQIATAIAGKTNAGTYSNIWEYAFIPLTSYYRCGIIKISEDDYIG